MPSVEQQIEQSRAKKKALIKKSILGFFVVLFVGVPRNPTTGKHQTRRLQNLAKQSVKHYKSRLASQNNGWQA